MGFYPHNKGGSLEVQERATNATVRRPICLGGVAVLTLLCALSARADTTQYAYDAMQRLTRVEYADGATVEYVYDLLGNRMIKTTTLPEAPTNNPPYQPSNPSIPNGVTNVPSIPRLEWTGGDPDSGDAVVYYVHFGESADAPLVWSGSETNYVPARLQFGATYYWFVVARDSHNAETVSPTWSFTVALQSPLCLYVVQRNAGAQAPYTNWLTAAAEIQTAVDEAWSGDTVWVSNGVYDTGGAALYGSLLTNRVLIGKAIAIRSVNGPVVTAIKGHQVPGWTNWDGAVRCAYVGTNAVLDGFTLTNGATRSSTLVGEGTGGGVYCALSGIVTNCVINGNSAGYEGGGAYLGTLNNCFLSGNTVDYYGGGSCGGTRNSCIFRDNYADEDGGGAYLGILNNCVISGNSAHVGGGERLCTLNNCTIFGNSASANGGGTAHGTLRNCIVYYNSALNGSNCYYGTVSYSCTTPLPTGVGNITNAPLFVDLAAGNCRLSAGSHCINAGYNSYAPLPNDLDGNPRIVGGKVDMGAYEFSDLIGVLGTNGDWIISGESANWGKGTDFGSCIWGTRLTNVFTIRNLFTNSLNVTGIALSGDGAAAFEVVAYSATISSNGTGTVSVAFAPSGAGTFPATAAISNTSPVIPYLLNLSGEGLKREQAITFPAIADQFATNIVGLTATADSGLPVSFTVTNGPASISGGTNLTFTGTGSVSVVASQAGDADWNAAAPVTNSLTVTKAQATVNLLDLEQVYEGTARTATVATEPLGLTVDVTYDGLAVAPTNAGSYAVTGTVNEALYQGSATGTLVVAQASQTITFPAIDNQIATNVVHLAATASSGLPVAFAVTDGPATISNGTNLTFSDTGDVAVVAQQAGDSNWEAASVVERSFQVLALPSIVDVSATNVFIHEEGVGRLFVRLTQAPTSSVSVVISRISGDESIYVQSNANLTFTAGNWSARQTVTLAQNADTNADYEYAEFGIAMSGHQDLNIEATAMDDDIGENIALAESGTTVSGYKAYYMTQAVDAVYCNASNYAYTIWTNNPPGYFMVDLKATSSVSCVRLLNWDWTYRVQRYQMDSSVDGTNWTSLADASGADRIGWDDWILTNPVLRYLRLTGLTNSASQCVFVPELEIYGERTIEWPQIMLSKTNDNVREGGEGRFFVRLSKAPFGSVIVYINRSDGDTNITIQSGSTRTFNASTWSGWQAVTLAAPEDENSEGETATFVATLAYATNQYVTAKVLDDDIAENLALASGGATATKTHGGQPGALIDGIHNVSTNYGWTIWTNLSDPGTITIDMKVTGTVARVRLLSHDWTCHVGRYLLDYSSDGTNWSMLADASGEDYAGWDDWDVSDKSMRYVRFTGLSNSYNQCCVVSELEVYGTRPMSKRALLPSHIALSARESAEESVVESAPIIVLTSDGLADETGWAAVDGGLQTAWVGQKVGGGYIVVGYEPALTLKALEVDLVAGSLTNIEYLYSRDAEAWQPLPEGLETNPISLNFLWLMFPDDGTTAAPKVFEIRANPKKHGRFSFP